MRFQWLRTPSMRLTVNVAARLCPDHGEILGWLGQLRCPVRVPYEAGPTGFRLARALTEARIECVVAVPSAREAIVAQAITVLSEPGGAIRTLVSSSTRCRTASACSGRSWVEQLNS